MAVMGGLYALLGLPPAFDTYYEKMYFHSIGIGMAALATYLVISTFGLEKHEPPIDFPMSYRAFAATLFAAAGGIFYLSPTLDAAVPDIPFGLFIVAFILIGDVGGALFIQLMFLPRKLNKTYSSRGAPPKGLNYFLRMFPTKREDFAAYRKTNATYWLAIAAVGSAFIAGMIGFINLWARTFGPSFFSGYISWLGLDTSGFIDATFDPHTHQMALALMGGVVALAAQHFHVLDLNGVKKSIARAGLWIASIGVVAMTIVLGAVALANYSPPTLLANGQANGIAGDDATMAIIGLGALIALAPLAVTQFGPHAKRSWRDPVRLSLLGTWILALVVNVAQGFYIEMNEDTFSSSLSANDGIYSSVQPMFGVFLLTAAALFLLAVDYYGVDGSVRRTIGWLAGAGMIIGSIGAFWWIFVDPSTGSIPYWTHIAGVLIVGASAIVATGSLYTAKIMRSRELASITRLEA